jgi:hypothetical protein
MGKSGDVVFKPCTGQTALRRRSPRHFLCFARGFAKRGVDTALQAEKMAEVDFSGKNVPGWPGKRDGVECPVTQ